MSPLPHMNGNRTTFAMLCLWLAMLTVIVSGCEATAQQIVPTQRPTLTPTVTLSPTRTPDLDATPTDLPTRVSAAPTGGPSPTPLFGPTRTPAEALTTPTRVANPNAPRIEFFRADSAAVSPGGSLTLFWSTRNVGLNDAQIYRLDRQGNRTLVYNIPPDGSQTVTTSSRDRGYVEYVLVVGQGGEQAQQSLIIPLTCPVEWFFSPAPDSCPNAPPDASLIIEQDFERGRMVYIAERDRVYVLFNDGSSPAWADFANLFDPAIHPNRDENFEQALIGTGFVQPVGRLGFLWRGRDSVRNRLGNALAPELSYDGSTQIAPVAEGDSLFISSSGSTVLQLLPGGASWQIITPSS